MSLSRYRVAIVGCGGIARAHAHGYRETGRCDVVACADIVPEAVQKFADQFDIEARYTDYREMMEQVQPDIVSVCTYHHLHHELTMNVAAYKPKAIYCEKPIALTLPDADEMITSCKRHGIRLIVGHQRRYGPQYTKAKELLDRGLIGNLYQMESYGHPWSSLLVDGTHSIDLLRFFNGDRPIDWVIGQVDTKSGSHRFGHPNEGAALAMFHFANGVRATITTGGYSPSRGAYPAKDGAALGADVPPEGYHKIVLHGYQGRIEIDGDDIVNGRPIVRIHRGADVEAVPVDFKGYPAIRDAVNDLLEQIESGREHRLNGESARASLEVIVAIFQSAKERSIVYLPLELDTIPLHELIADQIPGKG